MHGSQHGLRIAARLFQRPDAALEMPDAIGESARAIHRPTGGPLQHLKVVGPGSSLRHRAANLHQEGAERLADPIVNLAREPLPFDRELALPASFGQALVLEAPGDP